MKALLRFLSACACLAAILPAQGLAAEPVILDRAEIAYREFADPAAPGGAARDGAALAVKLPDAWRHRAERRVVLAAYRLRFDNPGGAALWVYVPRVRTNAEFLLNGAPVWDGGSMTPPLARHANAPFFFELPAALLRPGANELEVRVASGAGTNGGLSRVFVGPREALWPEYALRHFLQQGGVYVTSGIIAATSLYIFLIWLRMGRQQRGFLFLALAGLVWAARNLNLVWPGGAGWSVDAQWFVEVLSYFGHGVFFAFLGLFLLEEYEAPGSRIRRFMTWGIVAFLVPGPFLFMAYRSPTPAMTIWFAAAAPVLLGMIFILVRHARRQRRLGDWLFLALFVLLLALNVHDNLVLMGKLDFERINLAHYGGLAFFFAIAHMLVARYAEASLAVERLNVTLEDRLRAREAELSANYAALGGMEKATAVLEERARIMRDLHDGLGAQLLSAIHKVRRGRAASVDVEQVLQDCLNDMRLVIEVSDPHNANLATAVGGARYHLEQRLAAAGLHLVWEIGDIPDELDLGPTRTLQLVRILQEAVSNVIKHAGATTVTVTLALGRDDLRMSIADNGRGIGEEALGHPGHGLNNMRRRAEETGGALRIDSGPAGTSIEVHVPTGNAGGAA